MTTATSPAAPAVRQRSSPGVVLAHTARMAAVVLLIIVFTFLPFLPGRYDRLAIALSGLAQWLGLAGLLLVPVGGLWLVYELKQWVRSRQPGPQRHRSRPFAIAAVIAASFVALVVALGALVSVGLSLSLLVVAAWVYAFARALWPGLKRLKTPERAGFHPAPVYMVCLPLVVAAAQFTLLRPAVEFSRGHAIRQGAALISAIEAYRAAHGRYPLSLLSVWEDYDPNVMGIERYYYEPNGSAYNLYFEQFTFQLDTREIVMYNPLDEHVMSSHNIDILTLTPEQRAERQGWYARYDTPTPHWKYFWFD